MTSFRAIAAAEPGPAALQGLTDADLPDGDVTVAAAYSSLNYKDGLAEKILAGETRGRVVIDTTA